MKYFLSTVLIIAGLGIIIFTVYRNTTPERDMHTFSSFSVVRGSWEGYKTRFIINEGRVLDFAENEITTSEGQSYAMLRAVWMDDQPTFARVWQWTKDNLKRPNDSLFIWRYGKREDGTFGQLDENSSNSASDASSDIALALILAHQRFGQDQYLAEAKTILNDVWEPETGEYNGKRYFVAGNWARGKDQLIINPSYFSPYAFRIFAEIDPDRKWQELVETSYDVLEQWPGLPPDWLALNRKTGALSQDTQNNLSDLYGYDALRIPWRIAVDYQWFNDQRAKAYLQKLGEQLESIYLRDGKPVERYNAAREPKSDLESPAIYATAMSAWSLTNPELAKKIYDEKIKPLYSNDTRAFNSELPYYEQNWLWFTAALYEGYISNFYAQ